MQTRQDEDTTVAGGFIAAPAPEATAVASGCCGEPASGPAELELIDLDSDDTGSGCCGG
ncbi:hypothetical protein AB0F88_26620 [Streptosporangium sp. NPDC023963]|uniref:hypothetical protein n=1 Tax=Streptosporangium sp. NPDC023963 TaxID=3155608 RepID=UPI003426F2BD